MRAAVLSGVTDMTHQFRVRLPAAAPACFLNKRGHFLSSFGHRISFLNPVAQPAAREKAGLGTQGHPQSSEITAAL